MRQFANAMLLGIFLFIEKGGIQFELNYHDKNASLYVLLRTRDFDKKIHDCCRDSFFVKKRYIKEMAL